MHVLDTCCKHILFAAARYKFLPNLRTIISLCSYSPASLNIALSLCTALEHIHMQVQKLPASIELIAQNQSFDEAPRVCPPD